MTKENEVNPIRMWREWIVNSEKMWSDSISEMMGDPKVSAGMGRSMQEFLHIHRIFSESFAQYLAALNLPSRGDILDMSDRLGQVEDAIASVQVELREQRTLIAKLGDGTGDSGARKAPSRTKTPPAE